MAKSKEPYQPASIQDPGQHPVLQQLRNFDERVEHLKRGKGDMELTKEELEIWKKCVIGLASTPNGQMFIQSMVKHSGLFALEEADAHQMVVGRIRSAFYRKWVRPFLTKEQRNNVE